MKRSISFNPLFLIILFLISGINVWSQATLPFIYDSGNPGSSVNGLTQSGLGSDYATSPKMKFDTTQDYLILNFSGVPGALSFKIEWNQGSSASSRFPGNFILQESVDGITYTTVQLYNATNGTPLKNTVTANEIFTHLFPATRYLKWIYTSKTNGNIGIGAISLSTGINPVLNVSTNALDGFKYSIGNGPSPEQNFTIGGSSLFENIIITTPTNFEISKGTGNSFIATNPVTLVQADGAVVKTFVYVRLKQGLSVGNYSGNITLMTANTNLIPVACSGAVTPLPTIVMTDITDITLNTIQGTPVTQTINVSGANLNGNLSLQLSGVNTGLFSLSQYSVTQNSGIASNTVVTITYVPILTGSNTAALIMSSEGAIPVTRTLYGNSSISTDVNSLRSSFVINVENNNIIFMANAGEIVNLYNAVGQKLLQKQAVDGVNKISINFHGVILIKIGQRVSKVIQ